MDKKFFFCILFCAPCQSSVFLRHQFFISSGIRCIRAVNSAGECYLDTVEVGSSNLPSPIR
jgi:hypothetical protein